MSYQRILDVFTEIVSSDYLNTSTRMTFPFISSHSVITICREVAAIFKSEPSLLRINREVIVIGDIHGHILDLFRILKVFGFPPTSSYLFLGDFVDRENIMIIRGNHEFADMWLNCGFGTELSLLYRGNNLNTHFHEAFSMMPLGALLFDSVLCVHGGIGPMLTSLSQIEEIQRPVFRFDVEPLSSLVWSDPVDTIDNFQMSTRGLGYFFGGSALAKFLNEAKVSMVIRGHECVQPGVVVGLLDRLITVFSASNYCGVSGNLAGALIVKSATEYTSKVFEPLPYLYRRNVRQVPVNDWHLRHITIGSKSITGGFTGVRPSMSYSFSKTHPIRKPPALIDRNETKSGRPTVPTKKKVAPRPIKTPRPDSDTIPSYVRSSQTPATGFRHTLSGDLVIRMPEGAKGSSPPRRFQH